MLKALKNNRLVGSQAFGKILMQYNECLQRDGKVNNKKFYEEIVSKEIPSYSMQAWYNFLKRFKTEVGIKAPEVVSIIQSPAPDVVLSTTKTLLSNQAATSVFIQHALNIGAERAREIAENPQLMTAKEAMDFALKAMKAQDSRIHAVGKIREDNREEEKLNRAFSDDAYAE